MTVFLRPLPDFIVIPSLLGFFHGAEGGSKRAPDKVPDNIATGTFCYKYRKTYEKGQTK